MSGIIAIYLKSGINQSRFNEIIDALTDSMAHRGPDGRGVFRDRKVLLGHRRLATIDLSKGGDQPMISEGDRYVITFDGAIHNHIEIRTEHQQKGSQFRTQSDVEVLIEAYAREGSKVLNTLNGPFAFAIWDREKSELFIARDRFGIKPLYYFETDELTVFASEIKAIVPLVDNLKPNDRIIYDYLASGRVDHLDETFFEKIHRFPAGHHANVSAAGFCISQWYDIDEEIRRIQSDTMISSNARRDYVRSVRELFIASVGLRLRSDVPVGSFLSGGIDSSSVVTVVAKLLPKEAISNFQTYSAVYGDWFEQDEGKHIQTVVKKTGMVSNVTVPTQKSWEGLFTKFIYHQDEPVPSVSPVSQYCVMNLAHSKRAKVLLDGQGADEILAGYDYMVGYYLTELAAKKNLYLFLREIMLQIRRRNTTAILVFLFQVAPRAIQRRLSPKRTCFLSDNFADEYRKRFVVDALLYSGKSLNEALVNHVKYKLQHLLRWEDRSAMAFSIETRVPFLDHNLVAYVLSLPSEFKIRNGITKWVLREALKDCLPSSIVERTDKIGFAVPEKKWMNTKGLSFLQVIRESAHHLLGNYVNLNKVNEIIDYETPFNLRTSRDLFRIICLDCWLKAFF